MSSIRQNSGTLLGILVSVLIILISLTVNAEPAIVAEGHCGNDLTWALDSRGQLTISGTGDMWNLGIEDCWGGYGSSIYSVIIQDGVTSIGEFMFSNCNQTLSSIEISDSVMKIEKYAFTNCTKLTEVKMSKNIKHIGNGAFQSCQQLNSIRLPQGIKTIGVFAFSGCTGLSEIVLPDSITSIGNGAFPSTAILYCVSDSYPAEWAKDNGYSTEIIGPDEHIPKIITEALEPTCTEPGRSAEIICSICGETLSSGMPLPALGHDIMNHEAQIPTCTETGWEEYETCTRCDYTTYREIPASGHTAVDDPFIAPTRTTWGKTAGTHCETCGKILTGNEPVTPLADTPIVAIPQNVETIAQEAYYRSGVICVILPNGCSGIEALAFAECRDLKMILIPDSVVDIAADAFEGTEDFVIVTSFGSTAALFAHDHHIKCLIDE